jgi:hypothetical protein
MVAVFTQPDALIIVALIGGFGSWWQSYRNGKKLKPNGGTSPLDAINRIERKVDGLYAKHDEHARRLEQLEEYVTNPPAGGHVRRRKETS